MKKAGSTVLLLAALLATILELHTACGQSTTAKPNDTGDKPGICPPERIIPMDRFNDTLCQTDSECTGNKKCCVDNFDKFCKPPAEERPGQCPTTSYDETSPNRYDYCSSDSECASATKCCMKDGGMTCEPPVGVKSGECPPDPIRCIREVRSPCINDSTCPGNEKCCHSQCGLRCHDLNQELSDPKQEVVQEVVPNQEAVNPVCPPARKGFCPPDTTRPGMMTSCLVRCDNCKETEMCCPSGCGSVCKEMTKERPGYCPRNFLRCLPRQICCKDDLDCSDNEKCCNSECKMQCVSLLTDKPGMCPVPSTSCQPTNDTPDPNSVCTTDVHCTGDQKCCIVGCSRNCTEPTFV